MYIVDSEGNIDKRDSNLGISSLKVDITSDMFIHKIKNIFKEDEKKLFEIIPLIQNKSPIVLCINGFLTKDDKSAQEEWINSMAQIYPDSSVFHISWESENLKSLGKSIISFDLSDIGLISLFIVPTPIAIFIKKISKPWRSASSNAYNVGKKLGEFLADGTGEYILIGHSLGTRVIYSCLSELSKIEKNVV